MEERIFFILPRKIFNWLNFFPRKTYRGVSGRKVCRTRRRPLCRWWRSESCRGSYPSWYVRPADRCRWKRTLAVALRRSWNSWRRILRATTTTRITTPTTMPPARRAARARGACCDGTANRGKDPAAGRGAGSDSAPRGLPVCRGRFARNFWDFSTSCLLGCKREKQIVNIDHAFNYKYIVRNYNHIYTS